MACTYLKAIVKYHLISIVFFAYQIVELRSLICGAVPIEASSSSDRIFSNIEIRFFLLGLNKTG
jgi:hypothetical protein